MVKRESAAEPGVIIERNAPHPSLSPRERKRCCTLRICISKLYGAASSLLPASSPWRACNLECPHPRADAGKEKGGMRGATLESYAKLRLCFSWTGSDAEEVEILEVEDNLHLPRRAPGPLPMPYKLVTTPAF